MDDLKAFITMWEETGDIAAVLEKGLSLPTADKAEAYISSLSPAAQVKIRQSLADAMEALEIYALHLERETADIKIKIDQSVKTAKACLSYNLADIRRH